MSAQSSSNHPSTEMRLLDWKPIHQDNLLGFAKVELPSGIVISDVTIMHCEQGPWASPPGKPMVGRDGTAKRRPRGKSKYIAIIEFRSQEIGDSHDLRCLRDRTTSHQKLTTILLNVSRDRNVKRNGRRNARYNVGRNVIQFSNSVFEALSVPHPEALP